MKDPNENEPDNENGNDRPDKKKPAKKKKPRRRRGIAHAAPMRTWREKKSNNPKPDDGLDRSDPEGIAMMIERALVDMAEMQNCTRRTVQTRRSDLICFARWAQERDLKKVADLTRSVLESYTRHLARYRKPDGEPLAAESRIGRIHSIQAFFRFLVKRHYLEANPASDLELPRKPRRLLPKALDRAQVDELMAAPDVADPLGIRDRAMLEVLYSTGMRRAELVKLDLADLQKGRSVLMIRQGKGRKDRVVPVGSRALAWVERYLDECRPMLTVDDKEPALFITGFGGRFSGDTAGKTLTKHLRTAGIEKGGPHLLRHSCATHMLENGADIRFISQLLGHADVDTTAIYTEVAIAQLQEVHKRTHPSSKRPGEKDEDEEQNDHDKTAEEEEEQPGDDEK